MKIYVFRHGQSVFNHEQKFTGWLNPGLTALGFAQARKIARKLRGKKIDVAFCTHLLRSKQTLKEVLRYHPECRKIIEDDRMIERNYGELNGTLHEEFVRKIGAQLYNLEMYGDLITVFDKRMRRRAEKFLGEQEYASIHRGFNVRPPGGESFADVEKRVKSFIKELIKMMKRERASVAISAHGNSVRLFRKIMEKASVEETVKWAIPYDEYFKYAI